MTSSANIAGWSTLPPETEAERTERERRLQEVQQSERTAVSPCARPSSCSEWILLNLPTKPPTNASNLGTALVPGPGLHGSNRSQAKPALHGLRSTTSTSIKTAVSHGSRSSASSQSLPCYESKDLADEFWKFYGNFNVLFVDDADKFNTQFDSEGAAIFAFYDWIYREHRPCITTTNKDREWWSNLIGEAHTRRLFDDAHFEVRF